MKRLAIIIILLVTTSIWGQDYMGEMVSVDLINIDSPDMNWQFSRQRQWKSQWDIAKVLNIGDETCSHEWVKQYIKKSSMYSCLVVHDSRGCPNEWGKEEWICRKCLKNVVVHENRVLLPEEENPKSEFDILKEKIKGEK